MYVCADHMAHMRMGVCDPPGCKKIGKRLCPYCTLEPAKILKLQEEASPISTIPRNGSLMPLVPMDRRVPDLLHMVKNVTLWMIRNTANYVHYEMEPSRYLNKFQSDWIDAKLKNFIQKTRRHTPSHGIPQSEHTAFWNFMKPNSGGWDNVILDVQLKVDYFESRHYLNLPDIGKNIINSWKCWHSIFVILKSSTYIDNNNNLDLIINTFRTCLLFLNWRMTPWAHIMIDHISQFEKFLIRPVLLTCHAVEGHHKQIKRDFSHSLHSTKRKFGHSGLMDIMDVDNVILSLLGMNVFPWFKLRVPLGHSLQPISRGVLYNNLKIRMYVILWIKVIHQVLNARTTTL